jgi:hypothetical protein
MNYLFISDCLWYCGHILSSIATVFSHSNFEISISLVFLGLVSRPISRIKPIENMGMVSKFI